MELAKDWTLASQRPEALKIGEAGNEIHFLILTGSGAGDQYLIQGDFDLGVGKRSYNLGIYSYGESDPYMFKVSDITGNAVHPKIESKTIIQAVLKEARQRFESLPEDLGGVKSPHSKQDLLNFLENFTIEG